MCLIAVAYDASARYALIVAANRDERHERASDAAAWWGQGPNCLGGRDRVAGGSWLAMDRRGRLAAVTNRGPALGGSFESRGRLVSDFLGASTTAAAFVDALTAKRNCYAPFNLLLFDGGSLWFASNRGGDQALEPGVHSIGNTKLDSDWPKIAESRLRMQAASGLPDPEEALFALLAERKSVTAEGAVPEEAIFVVGAEFGTRCSTVVLIGRDGRVRFTERRFDRGGQRAGESRFEFRIDAGSPP